MKRRALTATTVIIALTAAMLFAGVVNAQPATATAQNIAHTPHDVHGTTPQVLGKDPSAGNDVSAYCCGHHHWGGCGHHHWGGCGHHHCRC